MKEFQKQILTIEGVIDNMNESIDLYEKIVKYDGFSVPSEIMRRRIKQKIGDIKAFVLQMEDPDINMNYIDALQTIDEKIKMKQLFTSLETQKQQLPPPS